MPQPRHMKKKQPAPRSSRHSVFNLLALPDNCLHLIVRFMDKETRQKLFMVSKGCQDKPGCAMLVLRACKTTFTTYYVWRHLPQPDLRSLLHWAAQLSTDMQLDVNCAGQGPTKVLHRLLVFIQDRTTRSGRALAMDIPVMYPGITRLRLLDFNSQSFIPELVVKAFPNLKELELHRWYRLSGPSQQIGPVLRRGLAGLQRLKLVMPSSANDAVQHAVEMLAHMPALASLSVDEVVVFSAAPASVLANLTHLELKCWSAPTSEAKAALTACSQLHSLKMCTWPGVDWLPWLSLLPQHVPHIRELQLQCTLTAGTLPHVLALPNLTALGVSNIDEGLLSADYSNATCTWRRLCFTVGFSNRITRLPLHTLDSPVACHSFNLESSADHAADMAAIRAAQPHLIRCGGISATDHCLTLTSSWSALTKQQAEELLEAWAPCLSAAPVKVVGARALMIQECVSRLWPEAE